jgi:hypothetical protein
MPLNVENKTYVAVDDESAIQQTSRIQRNRTSGIKYFFFGLAIILVVSSSVFLVYIFLLQQQKPTTQPRVVAQKAIIDTTTVTTAPPSPQTVVTTSPTIAPEVKSEKNYTIYIAAYSTEPPAVDDVTRWKNAGFVGTVVPTKRHYRVSLGKFASISDARTFAEGWTDAFEYGYWIGKL